VYQYQGTIVRVVDGDTVDINVDLGFGVWREDRFRLYGPDPDGNMGLNAPEVTTPEGKEARDYLRRLLLPGDPVTIRTIKDHREKYGRYLAVIYRPTNVNQLLLDTGHAVLKAY
jgi:micrococcal nuclease